MRPPTSLKMFASCHRRTEYPSVAAIAGTGWAGLEQPTMHRERSRQTTRTTASKNYRQKGETRTLVVNAEKSDQLDLHARPRAEQFVSTCLTHCNLEIPHAPEIDERLVGPPVGVGGGRGDGCGVLVPLSTAR